MSVLWELDGDGHLCWDRTFPPPPPSIVHVRELPVLLPLLVRDRSN